MTDPLVLVVADESDRGARAAVAAAARRLGPRRVQWVASSAFAAAGWRHTVAPGGATRTCLTGILDTALEDSGLRKVWFRASSWIPPRMAWADPSDYDYASAESVALAASWLHSVEPRTVNRVDGACVWGPSWSCAQWVSAARSVGLATAPRLAATSARLVAGWRGAPYDARLPHVAPSRSGTGSSVLVTGRHVTGWLAPTLGERCQELASLAGCDVLGVEFDEQGRVEAAEPLARLDTAEKVAAAAAYLCEVA